MVDSAGVLDIQAAVRSTSGSCEIDNKEWS